MLDQCVGWAPVIAVPETAWLKRRLLCCQTIFLFYVVVVQFLQVIFPLGFPFCFFETIISPHAVLLKFLPAFWFQPAFSKGFDIKCLIYVCAHCERGVWVSDLSDRKCHEEVKMGSRQRTGLRIFWGSLIRACRIYWIFSGASHPALSVTAETDETFIVTPDAFPEHLGRTERARWLVK